MPENPYKHLPELSGKEALLYLALIILIGFSLTGGKLPPVSPILVISCGDERQ
jgi:hypothetical protein